MTAASPAIAYAIVVRKSSASRMSGPTPIAIIPVNVTEIPARPKSRNRWTMGTDAGVWSIMRRRVSHQGTGTSPAASPEARTKLEGGLCVAEHADLQSRASGHRKIEALWCARPWAEHPAIRCFDVHVNVFRGRRDERDLHRARTFGPDGITLAGLVWIADVQRRSRR